MSQTLLERIRSADNLPSLPAVAVQVLRLTRQDDASVEDLAAVIQADPALTGKILKVVNSSLFGLPRGIASLSQAIGLLGLRRVKIMALSFSLIDTVRSAETDGFDFQMYWRRSLSTAAAARLLAKAVLRPAAEEAFVAGLLADIGMVVAWRCARDLYESAIQAFNATGRPISDIEAETIGLTHAELGRELLKNWGLPDVLCDAVGSHHGCNLASLPVSSLRLAKVVHSAASIADLFCRAIPSSELERVKRQCLDETGIEQDGLHDLLEALDHHVHDTASMLAVPVGQTLNYAELQMEAVTRMTQLSLEAESDRTVSQQREEQARMETERLQHEKAAILELASTDALTRVANRPAFDKRLDEELKRAYEMRHALGLIMMDVDHFKKFNDTYGHQAGDDVLRHVGDCLREVVRNVGFAARYGGEEFAVIVASEAATAVRNMAEEIRKAMEAQVVEYDKTKLRVTASFGAVCLRPQGTPVTAEQLIGQADRQLYKAKHNGRNRVEVEA
jgi:diguanylate cyclase (GGDEF)-like protein